mgnify:CR=1 FL=1
MRLTRRILATLALATLALAPGDRAARAEEPVVVLPRPRCRATVS